MKDTIRRVAVIFAVAMLYSNAYATQDFTTSSNVSVGAQVVKPSNHVTIKCTSIASAFAAEASHSSGDRRYGTNYTNTKIYWSEGTTLNASQAATDVYTAAGWSSL